MHFNLKKNLGIYLILLIFGLTFYNIVFYIHYNVIYYNYYLISRNKWLKKKKISSVLILKFLVKCKVNIVK